MRDQQEKATKEAPVVRNGGISAKTAAHFISEQRPSRRTATVSNTFFKKTDPRYPRYLVSHMILDYNVSSLH